MDLFSGQSAKRNVMGRPAWKIKIQNPNFDQHSEIDYLHQWNHMYQLQLGDKLRVSKKMSISPVFLSVSLENSDSIIIYLITHRSSNSLWIPMVFAIFPRFL